jgi:hypothetical protein
VEIGTIDSRSRLSTSTDEWGLDRTELPGLFNSLQAQPTVDCFASSSNNVCEAFFSKIPQTGSKAVDFFSQNLSPDEVYFCCPPIKEAGHMLRRLSRFKGVTALVVLPAWTGSTYWGMIKEGDGYIKEVKRWRIWEPRCQDSGLGRSLFTSGTGIQMWAGLLYTGTVRRTVRQQ